MKEMIKRILGSETLQLRVSCSQEEAAARLATSIETDLRKVKGTRPAYGSVSPSHVTFAIFRPALPSAFRWYFDGDIMPLGGGTLVKGELALSRFSKAFLGVWVAFTVLVGALAATQALAGGFASAVSGMPTDGLSAHAFFVMLAFGGAALIVPGLARVPKDVAEIRAIVERSFEGAKA